MLSALAEGSYPAVEPDPQATHVILIVSEAAGAAQDASTVSSYRVLRNGSLQVLDGAVPLTETAACWVAIPQNGRFAYVTNAGSGTVSGISIGRRGGLELLDEDGVTGVTGEGSTPMGSVEVPTTANGMAAL